MATPAVAVTTAAQAATGLGVLVGVAPVLISLLVSISATGSTHVSIMTAGRSIYATARAGEAPAALTRLSRWDTPARALWVQAAPAIVLILLPGAGLGAVMSFRETWSWCFFAVTAAAMLRLRKTQPQLERPYRAPLHSAVLCIVASGLIIASTLYGQPLAALLAFGFVGAGWLTHVGCVAR